MTRRDLGEALEEDRGQGEVARRQHAHAALARRSIDLGVLLVREPRASDDDVRAARDRRRDVRSHRGRARVVDEDVGARFERLPDRAAHDEPRQVGIPERLGQGFTRVGSRDRARELQIGGPGDGGREPSAHPAGRAGEADADPSAQRAAGESGSLRTTASRMSSGAIGFFSSRNFWPWLFAVK